MLAVGVAAAVGATGDGGRIAASQRASGCPIFPATNVWNKRVDSLPVAANSQTMINAIGAGVGLHPDFGSYPGYGIPYNVVTGKTKKVKVQLGYADQSYRGGYPIPAKPRIEAGSDRHLLIVDKTTCQLYEMWRAVHTEIRLDSRFGRDLEPAFQQPSPKHLDERRRCRASDPARPGALPGRQERRDQPRAALHRAGYVCRAHLSRSPRRRLRPVQPAASDGAATTVESLFDVSQLAPQARPIAVALKRYGMILADNGSPWYITGTSNRLFSDDALHTLGMITGNDLRSSTPARFETADQPGSGRSRLALSSSRATDARISSVRD